MFKKTVQTHIAYEHYCSGSDPILNKNKKCVEHNFPPIIPVSQSHQFRNFLKQLLHLLRSSSMNLLLLSWNHLYFCSQSHPNTLILQLLRAGQ